MKVDSISNKADLIGIASAVLCLIHCLVPPIIFLFFGHLIEHSHDHFFRWDYFFLAFSCYAVYHATQHAVNNFIKGLLWLSFGVLTIAILLHHIPNMEYIAYLASLGLIGGHLINLKMMRAA
ncbi:MAG: MerC domain-containing protein [Chitinophagales bacterium]